jgi:hypothetical protein
MSGIQLSQRTTLTANLIDVDAEWTSPLAMPEAAEQLSPPPVVEEQLSHGLVNPVAYIKTRTQILGGGQPS